MTQSGENGNGKHEPNPEDIQVFNPAFLEQDEEQTESIGWVEEDIKGEDMKFPAELPEELKPEDDSDGESKSSNN